MLKDTPATVCALCLEGPAVGLVPSGACQGLSCCARCLDAISEALPAGPDLIELDLASPDHEGPALVLRGAPAALREVLDGLPSAICDYGSSVSDFVDLAGPRPRVVVWAACRNVTLRELVGAVKSVALRARYDVRVDGALRAQAQEGRAA